MLYQLSYARKLPAPIEARGTRQPYVIRSFGHMGVDKDERHDTDRRTNAPSQVPNTSNSGCNRTARWVLCAVQPGIHRHGSDGK